MLVVITGQQLLHPFFCPQHKIPQPHYKSKHNLLLLLWSSERRGIYWRFGTTCRSHLQGTWSPTHEHGAYRLSRTSANNQSTPRNIPEQRGSRLRRGWSPKSRSEVCSVVDDANFGKIRPRTRETWSSCWRKYNPSVYGFCCGCVDSRYDKSFALTGCIYFFMNSTNTWGRPDLKTWQRYTVWRMNMYTFNCMYRVIKKSLCTWW
jgi:hypothetical protein